MSVRKALMVVTAAALVASMAGTAHGIVYGEPSPDDYQQVGSMVIHIPDFETEEGEVLDLYLQACSGTLIDGKNDAELFLTAAHCVVGLEEFIEETFDVEPGEYFIWVTFDFQISPTGTYFGGEIHAHPDFFTHGLADLFDVAVIELNSTPTQGNGSLPTERGELPPAGLLDQMKMSGELKDATFVAVGYGTVRDSRKTSFQNFTNPDERRKGEQEFLSLTKAWITLSMNEATGNSGTCYGDSGGPHFLGDSNVIVSLTVTGDVPCKASDKTYRLDTDSARGFLEDFVDLP